MYDKLISKTVAGLWRSPEGDKVSFGFSDGTFATLATFADCCSETWIADIIGVEAVIGAEIRQITNMAKSYSENDPRSRQDHDEIFGIKIQTSAGACDLIFRNSSNGYYNGSIESVTDDTPDADWMKITDDYQG